MPSIIDRPANRMPPGSVTVPQTFDDVACTVCGCVCDDIRVEVDSGRLAASRGLCKLAEPWFERLQAHLPPAAAAVAAEIDGQPAPLEEAISRASRILTNSRAPLVYGLSRSSTDGQRAAVRLADQLGAVIDTTASTCHAPSIVALQTVGESTSTLGEVRNRSDLIVYWGSNPAKSHPRHIERVVEAPGQFAPRGRADRRLIVVDAVETETAALADRFVQVEANRDFELVWALRGFVQDEPAFTGGETPASAGGVPWPQIETLADELTSARYGALFFGLGVTRGEVPHTTVEALLRLVTDLNARTRFIVRRMRIPGDVTGADCVLCWQTGFPFSVDLSRGYPRYNPGEYTAGALLERREVDAVVLVGSEDVTKLSPAAQLAFSEMPVIVLDYPGTALPVPAAVRFTTAVYGVHRAGTAYRMDEVPIPLRPFLESSLPSDEEVLRAIGSAARGATGDDCKVRASRT